MNKSERARELSQKIMDVFEEAKDEGFEIWICEKDDGNAVSVVKNVEYDNKDDRIYINADYSFPNEK